MQIPILSLKKMNVHILILDKYFEKLILWFYSNKIMVKKPPKILSYYNNNIITTKIII